MAGTITHSWNGTVLTIKSDSGTSSMDLKGAKGDDGARGAQGAKGERGGGALIDDNTISTNETWSSSGIMNRFSEAMAYTGNPVMCSPLANLPLDITTNIEPIQDGSGEVSPTNIRAISGMSAISVVRCGKNIFKTSLKDAIKAYNSTINSITENVSVSEWGAKNAIKVVGGSGTSSIVLTVSSGNKSIVGNRYTHSIYIKNNNSRNGIKVSNNGLLNGTGDITIPAGSAKRIEISGDGNTGRGLQFNISTLTVGNTFDITLWHPQIEIADAATDYEPYRGNTYDMELGQTVYGGSVDWNRGKLIIDWALKTFDGTETFGAYGVIADNTARTFYTPTPNGEITQTKDIGKIVCDRYKSVSFNTLYAGNTPSISLYTNGHIALRVPFTTIEEWKAYLTEQNAAGTPLQIAYKLETPIEVSLTPQIIKAISGTNTLITNAKELIVFGRVDTMATIKKLEERIAALEAAANGGE